MTVPRSIKRWAIALLAALAVAGLVRVFAIATFRLPDGRFVVVNRWSYGLRPPLPSLFGYGRLGHETGMAKGDRVAFDSPLEDAGNGTRQIFVGYCAAGPGDTVRLKGGTFPIPRKGEPAEITPANRAVLQEALQRYENTQALTGPDGRLYIKGMPIKKIRLTHDYYWMQTPDQFPLLDSRTFGLVPMELVIGRIIR